MTLDYRADYLESIGAAEPENTEPVVEKEEKIDYKADFLEAQEEASVTLANNTPKEVPTALDRIFMQPLERAGERQEAIGGRIAEQFQPVDINDTDLSKGTDLSLIHI